jgi:hypothetical protein
MNYFLMKSKWIMTKLFNYNNATILVAIAISAAIWLITLNKQDIKSNHISAKVFEGFNGWGYDILLGDSLLIHQESIPSIPGKTGFQKKEHAEQTAELIIDKMKNGKFPTVTKFEIEKICR